MPIIHKPEKAPYQSEFICFAALSHDFETWKKGYPICHMRHTPYAPPAGDCRF